MNPFIPTVIEVLVLLLLCLVSLGLSRTLRKIGPDTGSTPTGLGSLLKFLITPLIVLGLTWSLVQLLGYLPGPAAWLQENPKHLTAWYLFWSGLTVLLLLEGTAHLLFARRGRELPIPGLLLGIARGLAVLGLAFAVLRFELGINIAPLLASTALITAVIGFALQGVLGNLLAGMSLHIYPQRHARRLDRDGWVDRQGDGNQLARNPHPHPGRPRDDRAQRQAQRVDGAQHGAAQPRCGGTPSTWAPATATPPTT